MALTLTGYNAVFQRKIKTKNHPVKNIVKGTQDTTLFCEEVMKLKIEQSKQA